MRPRPSAQDYTVSVHAQAVTIGVAVLSKRDVRNAFATDLNRSYVVFEVGVYPDNPGSSGSPKQKGTWIAGSSVGVASGTASIPAPSKGPYSDDDRDRMQAELADKSLPQAPLVQPVAGYLYFPAGKKKGNYELRYLGHAGSVKLIVPATASK